MTFNTKIARFFLRASNNDFFSIFKKLKIFLNHFQWCIHFQWNNQIFNKWNNWQLRSTKQTFQSKEIIFKRQIFFIKINILKFQNICSFHDDLSCVKLHKNALLSLCKYLANVWNSLFIPLVQHSLAVN